MHEGKVKVPAPSKPTDRAINEDVAEAGVLNSNELAVLHASCVPYEMYAMNVAIRVDRAGNHATVGKDRNILCKARQFFRSRCAFSKIGECSRALWSDRNYVSSRTRINTG